MIMQANQSWHRGKKKYSGRGLRKGLSRLERAEPALAQEKFQGGKKEGDSKTRVEKGTNCTFQGKTSCRQIVHSDIGNSDYELCGSYGGQVKDPEANRGEETPLSKGQGLDVF